MVATVYFVGVCVAGGCYRFVSVIEEMLEWLIDVRILVAVVQECLVDATNSLMEDAPT